VATVTGLLRQSTAGLMSSILTRSLYCRKYKRYRKWTPVLTSLFGWECAADQAVWHECQTVPGTSLAC
jgi:hypothetical protein